MWLKQLELEKTGSRTVTPDVEIKVERAKLEQAQRLITQLQKQLVERESNNLKQLVQQSMRLQFQKMQIKQSEQENQFLKVICEVNPQKKPVVEKQLADLKVPVKQIFTEIPFGKNKLDTITESSKTTLESKPTGPSSPVQSPKAVKIVPIDQEKHKRVFSSPQLIRPVVRENLSSKEQK